LADALVGMHEMVSIAIVNRELESGDYDEVVLDTAPSRHALEFIDYPARLVAMLEGRTVRWLAAMADHAGASVDDPPNDRSVIAWGKRRVQALLGKVAGHLALRDVSALFNDLIAVRSRWLELLNAVRQRLDARETRYLVVSAPSAASVDDAQYLVLELGRRGRFTHRLLVNRAVDSVPRWLTSVHPSRDATLVKVHQAYLAEYRSRVVQTQRACARLAEAAGAQVPLTRLPALQTTDPRVILTALADALGGLPGP
jgi:anion-transporting  ArsA/GET3 family ATPase